VGGATYSVTADNTGHWTLDTGAVSPTSGTLNLVDGSNAVVLNEAGVIGASKVIFDNSPPDAAVLTTSTFTDGLFKGVDSSSGISVPIRSGIVLSGTAEAGSKVDLQIGGATYETYANSAGYWAVNLRTPAGGELTLTPGTMSVNLKVTDTSGKYTESTDSVIYKPLIAWESDFDANRFNIIGLDDDMIMNDKPVSLTIKGILHDTKAININGTTYSHYFLGANDPDTFMETWGYFDWTFTPDPEVWRTGLNEITYVNAGQTYYLYIDDLPASTEAPTLDPTTLTDDTPVLSGSAQPGSTLSVMLGGVGYSIDVGDDGLWSLDTSVLSPDSGNLEGNMQMLNFSFAGFNPSLSIATHDLVAGDVLNLYAQNINAEGARTLLQSWTIPSDAASSSEDYLFELPANLFSYLTPVGSRSNFYVDLEVLHQGVLMQAYQMETDPSLALITNPEYLPVLPVAGDFVSDPNIEYIDILSEQSVAKVSSLTDKSADVLLLITASDANGDAVDYLDEATGELVDMGVDIRGFVTWGELADAEQVSVTPVTELAVRLAQLDGNIALDEGAHAAMASVSDFFKLADLNGAIMTITSDAYNEVDGINDAEHYGQILALLSGGDVVTGSMDATLNEMLAIVAGVTDIATARSTIETWAAAYEAGPNADLADLTYALDLISQSLDEVEPSL
jgi:hypothetical protein